MVAATYATRQPLSATGSSAPPPQIGNNPAALRNHQATIWMGGIEHGITEELVYELCLQCGPIQAITMPKDKLTGELPGYAFVEFTTAESADYAIKTLNYLRLGSRTLRVNKSQKAGDSNGLPDGPHSAAAETTRKEEAGWYAKLYVGNLSYEVDERLLYETFASFGRILSARVIIDNETQKHRGFGFVVYDSFEWSDAAMAALTGQYVKGRPLNITYAFKKDANGMLSNERHGSPEERALAAAAQSRQQTGAAPGFPSTAQPPSLPQQLPVQPPPIGAAYQHPPYPVQSGYAPPPPQTQQQYSFAPPVPQLQHPHAQPAAAYPQPSPSEAMYPPTQPMYPSYQPPSHQAQHHLPQGR